MRVDADWRYIVSDAATSKKPYRMEFDVGTIKHLGVKMYSTLPPVIGELVANAWDANATKVEITIPETRINEQTSEIVIADNGDGMSDEEVRDKYLIIGRDRREEEQCDKTLEPYFRKIMGRKGIGKFSAFGIAKEIVVESAKGDEVSHFRMNYDELMEKEKEREIEFDPLPATGDIDEGTKITLRHITIYRTRPIPIDSIRQKLARRFAVIGAQYNFEIIINGDAISPEDRDLRRLLEKDMNGERYEREYNNEEIVSETNWRVSGWIGALNHTSSEDDGIDRGIVLMARGKMVQEPFMFNAVVGQQFAFSYLVGELHVDFVDEEEDTIATTRNSLVWDTEANNALMEWGKAQINGFTREWSRRRRKDREHQLENYAPYRQFREQAEEIDNQRALKLADKLIRQTIEHNPDIDVDELESLTQTCLDFLEFNAFWDIAEELTNTGIEDTGKLINLFKEWEIVEAKEMARVTEGRIKTIEKLQELIDTNALEVPTMHNFLKEFPWVLDPRWTLVADEVHYTTLLREYFPENEQVLEENRRIDFLCVGEGTNLIVVEIKRPRSRATMDELNQIERYVSFIRHQIRQASGPDRPYERAIGYLLCGGLKDDYEVIGKKDNLAEAQIYVKLYGDLLGMVKRAHEEFLERYKELQDAKQTANQLYV